MSKDRVHFSLQANIRTEQGGATIKAAIKAFSLDLKQAYYLSNGIELQIICRPSQFARFMIYRNDMGGNNSFKELSPKLVPAR